MAKTLEPNVPYQLPINGIYQNRTAVDTGSQTATALQREQFWLYMKGKPQADGQRDVNRWKPPRTGPVVL